MNSLELYELRNSLYMHLKKQNIPNEVKRMVCKELLQMIETDTNNEIMSQLAEREVKKE